MNFLQLLRLLRQLPIRKLMNFPTDFTNSEAVRTWVRAVVESIEVVAKLTNTKLDDRILAGIKAALLNDEIWNTVHGLLVQLLVRKPLVSAGDEYEVQKVSKIIGISPMLIMLIIQAVRILLDILWKRRAN